MTQTKPDFSQLSVAERIQLAEDLWDSVAADSTDAVVLSDEQSEIVADRVRAHEASPDSAIAWEKVRAKLFSKSS